MAAAAADPASAPWPWAPPLRARVPGLSAEQIRRVVVAHQGALRACYEIEAQRSPNLRGGVTVNWHIDPSGSVTTDSVGNSTLGNARVEGCILRQVKVWHFPTADAPSDVGYPFKFGVGDLAAPPDRPDGMRSRAVPGTGVAGALVLLGLAGCGGASPVVDRPGRGIVETMAASSPPHAPEEREASGAPGDASFFRAYAASRGFRLGHPTAIRPLPDGSAVLFLRATPRDPRQSLYEMDVRSGKTRTVIAPDAIARGGETLSPAEKGRRERMRVVASGFTDYELTRDGAHVLVSLSGHLFFVDRTSGASRELPTGDGAVIDPHLSPDGKSVAYVVGNDVFALGIEDRKPHAVTHGGTDDLTHGVAEFVAQEELDRSRGFWWSPDGRTVLYEEADLQGVERRTLADPGRPDSAPERIAYPRPGKPNAKVRLGLARGASTTWVQWDRDVYPYLARVVWSEDGPPLLYVLDRPQKTGLLLALDPETGKTREILREHDDAFLEVDPSVPSVLPGGREALWSSERDGVSRLYKVDLASGALAPAAQKGFGYRSVLGVDARGSLALIEASTEPSEAHVYVVSLAAGGATPPRRIDQGQLSLAAAARNAPQQNIVPLREGGFGRHAAYLLRDLAGHELAKIPEDAEPPPFLPTTRLETVGPDEVRVAITVPRHFDPARRYPVVDWAYGGPHLAMVAADADRCLFQQMLADRVGGVVVSIDARGTPYRGRDWERAIAGRFAEVPLEGHVTALHELAAKHPEMDLGRVGVVGWSFGGYFSALAMLRHPELYKVAVSGAPVSDWTEYDTAYTERYLGVPRPDEAAPIPSTPPTLSRYSPRSPSTPTTRRVRCCSFTAPRTTTCTLQIPWSWPARSSARAAVRALSLGWRDPHAARSGARRGDVVTGRRLPRRAPGPGHAPRKIAASAAVHRSASGARPVNEPPTIGSGLHGPVVPSSRPCAGTSCSPSPCTWVSCSRWRRCRDARPWPRRCRRSCTTWPR